MRLGNRPVTPKVERARSKKLLDRARGQPCLVCGMTGEAHHLTFAQPRAMASKTGDQFVVPLCHACHMELHNSPVSERNWWTLNGIDPLDWVREQDNGNI